MPDRAAPMKRSGFARTPPTPLERSNTPGLRFSGLTRHTPIRRGPITPRRRDTGPGRDVKSLIRTRAKRRCEACGRSKGRMDVHHRRPRGMGGTVDPAANLPSNLVLLDCHRWIESHRTVSLDLGWLVRQGHDPALVALTLWSDREVLLADDGRYVEYQDQQKGA
jgi:5-methylcytosine-specific restriction enzyme A